MALEFLLGAAAICVPQARVPLLVGKFTLSALQSAREHRIRKKAASCDCLDEKALAKDDERVLLQWHDLDCTLTDKQGHVKQILKGLNGEAQPGRLLALMGPSGSGKTSLLNALAGQVPRNAAMHLSGSITANGAPAHASGHRQGYVQQEDLFFSNLTVKEVLLMAAQLRLPKATGDAAKEAYVTDLIQRLGLAKSANTIVGDKKTRGLSGGERKRLSIGCELIGSPTLIFADEPTTGLDSFQAEKVMETLKGLAASGATVVVSIHQPRSSIFAMFDDLILLSEGELLYSGAAKDAMAYFEGLGHGCPPHYNPAEFLADLISIDPTSSEAEVASRERVRGLVEAYKSGGQRSAARSMAVPFAIPLSANESSSPAGWRRQFRLLLTRSWRQVTRDRVTNVTRAMTNVSSAVIFGCIFWRMGRGQTSIQDRMGLLQVAAINTAMSSLIKTLNVFPTERTIVTRERAQRSYGVLPYFTGKLAAELPVGAVFPLLFAAVMYPMTGLNPNLGRFGKLLGILTLESFASASLGLAVGSVAPSTEAALAIGPAVMVVFIVFGGFYVNSENVPTLLRWIPKTSMIKYAFEALCVNEFEGMSFEAEDASGLKTGEQVLSRFSFGDSTIRGALRGQAKVLLFNYWVTYCVLKSKKPRFQRLEEPQEPQDAAKSS